MKQSKEQKRYLDPSILLVVRKQCRTFHLSNASKIALGGFLSLAGFIILLLALLTTTGTVNLEGVVKTEFIVTVAIVVGVLDIICGFLLFWKK